MQQTQSLAIVRLSCTMRLTQQSTYNKTAVRLSPTINNGKNLRDPDCRHEIASLYTAHLVARFGSTRPAGYHGPRALAGDVFAEQPRSRRNRPAP